MAGATYNLALPLARKLPELDATRKGHADGRWATFQALAVCDLQLEFQSHQSSMPEDGVLLQRQISPMKKHEVAVEIAGFQTFQSPPYQANCG
jgi:hypothetical protein